MDRSRAEPAAGVLLQTFGGQYNLKMRKIWPLRRPTARLRQAQLNGLNTEAYLRDVLTRIAEYLARRLGDLLPWNWVPLPALDQAA